MHAEESEGRTEAQALALLEFVAFSRTVCLHPSGSGSSVLPWVLPPV